MREVVSAAEVRQMTDDLAATLQDGGLSPAEQAEVLSDHALCRRLGVLPETLSRAFSGEIEPEGGDVRRELGRVIALREMLCIRNLAAGGSATGWIFLSRQPRWGGLTDGKREERAPAVLEVRINGADGKPLDPERLLGGGEETDGGT